MSLCLGKKKKKKTCINPLSPAYIDFFAGGRTPATEVFFVENKTKIVLIFKEDYDKSDGTTIIIDSGYNNWSMDSDLLNALGVNGILMQTGSYNIDFSNHLYGKVEIPITVF